MHVCPPRLHHSDNNAHLLLLILCARADTLTEGLPLSTKPSPRRSTS